MTLLGKLGHRLVATEVVNLALLKWFAIVLSLAALVVLVVLLRSSLHDWLHEGWGVVILSPVFAVCVFVLGSFIFDLIEDHRTRCRLT